MNPLLIYQQDIFKKLAVDFRQGSKILDVGCGQGQDVLYLAKKYQCQVIGIDPISDKNWSKYKTKTTDFKVGSIFKLPFADCQFDYLFLKDVLHHIDEEGQDFSTQQKGLKELKRVTKKGGQIIIVEANRANPIFYFHMTLMKGHKHFRRSYFRRLVSSVFDSVEFRSFESHVYPQKGMAIFKAIEKFMEQAPFFEPFLSYNIAIISKK